MYCTVACPPNHIDGHAFNLYLVPKDRTKLADFLNKEYGIDIEWTYGQVIRTPHNYGRSRNRD